MAPALSRKEFTAATHFTGVKVKQTHISFHLQRTYQGQFFSAQKVKKTETKSLFFPVDLSQLFSRNCHLFASGYANFEPS
jgi:hypothetical protein